MFKNSPFYVETNLGKLELTKGAYLTMQKRKNSTIKTLVKTKAITKDSNKPTVRRTLRPRHDEDSRYDEVCMVNHKGD